MTHYKLQRSTRYHAGSVDSDGQNIGIDIESLGLGAEIPGSSGVRLSGDVTGMEALLDALAGALDQAAELRAMAYRRSEMTQEYYGDRGTAEHECNLGPGVGDACTCP